MRISRYIAAIMAVCASFTLVSCSSDASNEKAAKTNSQVEKAKSEAVDNAGEQPVSSNAKLPVIASRNAGDGLRIDLNEVTTSSAATTVVFTAVNTNKSGEELSVGGRFDDGTHQVPVNDKGRTKDGGYHLWYTTDGVKLIEGKHAKVYRAAYDTSGECLCSTDLGSLSIKGGESVVLQTIFAGLPKDVTTVDVTIPEAGVFKKVKVSR